LLLDRSLDELQEAFEEQIHGEEVPPKKRVRVRVKAKLREHLITTCVIRSVFCFCFFGGGSFGVCGWTH
jgi:hypothetical protein